MYIIPLTAEKNINPHKDMIYFIFTQGFLFFLKFYFILEYI